MKCTVSFVSVVVSILIVGSLAIIIVLTIPGKIAYSLPINVSHSAFP
jgi:hypothetical protein